MVYTLRTQFLLEIGTVHCFFHTFLNSLSVNFCKVALCYCTQFIISYIIKYQPEPKKSIFFSSKIQRFRYDDTFCEKLGTHVDFKIHFDVGPYYEESSSSTSTESRVYGRGRILFPNIELLFSIQVSLSLLSVENSDINCFFCRGCSSTTPHPISAYGRDCSPG